MNWRATQSNDGQTILLEGSLELKIVDEDRPRNLTLEDNEETMREPRARRHQIDFSHKLQDGETLLVAPSHAVGDNKFLLVLITPRNVEVN
ncbi:MAG: hypothetical protein U1D30_23250 [Planctomycetota bacterium]